LTFVKHSVVSSSIVRFAISKVKRFDGVQDVFYLNGYVFRSPPKQSSYVESSIRRVQTTTALAKVAF